jgi:DNA-binding NarL/FixJ family response regulator
VFAENNDAEDFQVVTAPIRLLIADDHFWIREGVRYAVSRTDIQVVGMAASGAEAIQSALSQPCDVLLLDIDLPEHDGFEVLATLKSKRPEVRILFYSCHDRPDFVDRAQRLGASGFLSKSADLEALIDAIRTVGRGETFWKVGAEGGKRHRLSMKPGLK